MRHQLTILLCPLFYSQEVRGVSIVLRVVNFFVLVFAITPAISNADEFEDLPDFSLEQLLDIEVFTASKFNQKMSEAPSRVTVITAENIREQGYRHLKDILNSVAGLYTTYDRNYSYIGVRGFGIPGDYNTRVLLLLDGVRVNENVYDSLVLDFDGIVNIDLIQRVEFSSGAGSSIYGANAFFGVINIITKDGDAIDGAQLSIDVMNDNGRKYRLSVGKIFDNQVEILFSTSAYESDGSDLYYPEFDDPANNFGVAEDLDYHDANNVLFKLNYQNWGFEAAFNDRTKGIPTASFGQEFNLSPSETQDSWSFASINYKKIISNDSHMDSHLSWHRYEYSGDYIYDYPPLTVNRDETIGEWLILESRFQTDYFDDHKLTFGIEFQDNIKQYQANFDRDPFDSYLDDLQKTKTYGIYFQDEFRFSASLLMNIGLRYDRFDISDAVDKKQIINPRLAFIYSLRTETTLKLIYGSAYRNPNSYELYYGSAVGFLPSENLKPEEIESLELNVEHFVNNNFRLTASMYENTTENLIGLNSELLSGDIFFDNLNEVVARGIDFEADYIGENGTRIRSSYSHVKAENTTTNQSPPNSPENMFKINISRGVWRDKINIAFEYQYMSERLSPQGTFVSSFSVSNLTLVTENLYEGLTLSGSIYNLFDKKYADPASEEHLQQHIEQDRRNFRLKLTYSF